MGSVSAARHTAGRPSLGSRPQCPRRRLDLRFQGSISISLGYCAFKMVSQHMARRGGRQFSVGMPDEAPGVWGNAESIRKHPFFSRQHMHERIDHNGNRLREEHDLHARLQICL